MKKHKEMHGMHGLKEVSFVGKPETIKEKKEDVMEHMKKRKHMRHEWLEKAKKNRKVIVGLYK
jgi:urocanate hydratase